MMTDPVRRRRILSGLLAVPQVVRVMRVWREPDADLVAVGQPTAMHRGIVHPGIAVESEKVAFGDVAPGIHAVMAQRRKTADINVRSPLHHLLYGGLITPDDNRSLPRLDPFIAGEAGFLHLRTHGPRQAQAAGH